MNASYEVKGDYLYVKAVGEFTLPDARDILREWIEEARSHSLKRVLCDITRVTGFHDRQTSTLNRFSTGEFVAQSMPGGFKLVVLETPQQFAGGQGRFGENVMVNRGVSVRVTTSLDEALEWLGAVSTDKPAGVGSE